MTHPTEPCVVELLPCPFCGGDPITEFAQTPEGDGAYFVHCQNDGCPAWPNTQGDTEAEAIAAWNTRTAAEAASREEWPAALLEQSCCLGLIGKNVIIDCETRAEAEEVLDWLCGERTARATLTAQVEALTAEVGRLLAAVDALGLRELVAGWNGENREDGPYEPHPPRLGVTLRTNAGLVYELDARAEAARAALTSTSDGGEA